MTPRTKRKTVEERITVPLRLDRQTIAFYRRVAKLAQTDINTAVCVSIAMATVNARNARTRTKR